MHKLYDPARFCPKCGNGQVWSEYRPYRYTSYGPRKSDENAPADEHIRRDCSRCKYWWYEKPSTRHLRKSAAAATGIEIRGEEIESGKTEGLPE